MGARDGDILDFEVTSNVPAPDQPADPDATAAPVTEAPATKTADVASEPEAAPEEPPRDAHGQFRRRHRARSQQASREDVPRIQSLLDKNKELQKQLEDLKKPAAQASPAAQPPQQAPPQQQPQQFAPPPQQRPVGIPTTFPDYTVWATLDGNAGRTFDEYSDARSDWRWLVNDQQRRHFDAMQTAMQTRMSRVEAYEKAKTDARTKYPDYDTVLAAAPNISAVMVEALLASEKPAEIAYHLATHPELASQLFEETKSHDPSAHGPMKRLLESFLVAPAMSASPTAQHAADKKTGSALALVPPPPAPKPPSPVRTQAPVSADSDQPGDDASLEDHERYFHKGGRRR